MPRRFPFTFVLAGVLLVLLAMTGFSQEQAKPGFDKKDGLSLTVSLEKKSYQLGEDITLSFKLKNEADHDIYIGDGYLGPQYQEVGHKRHFELHLTDENNAPLQFWSDQLTEGHTSGIRKVFRLKPGETYAGSLYLVASGRKEIKVADIAQKTQSGIVENRKTDRRHELGKDGHKYSLWVVYQVDPATHGVWQPPKEFKDELLWKGAVKTSPLAFEIADK
jgi:hypothetical protein